MSSSSSQSQIVHNATIFNDDQSAIVYEDVVSYYKKLAKRDTIAIIVDDTNESERSFKWALTHLIQTCDPTDTQILVLYPISRHNPTPQKISESHTLLKRFSDLILQSNFTKNNTLQGPEITESQTTLPAYSETSDKDFDSNLFTPETDSTERGWYGHHRAIVIPANFPSEVKTHLDNLKVNKMVVVATDQSKGKVMRKLQVSGDLVEYLTLNSSVPVFVVRGNLDVSGSAGSGSASSSHSGDVSTPDYK
ncbi:hypothetical protein HDU76_002683 [Blyttiomyces sp. JEL0837]|nr:hypothetical protein HDU76_002683 [Blyttiomyces sp. JEL0837]